MKKAYIVLLLAVLLISCKTKERYITSVEKVVDSLYIKTETIVSPLLTDAITIKELCKDSVPVQFKKVFVVDGDSIEILTNKNNELVIEVNRLKKEMRSDSISKVHDSKKVDVSETTVTKRGWSKFTLLLIGVIIAFISFPFIPKFLNSAFRKLVGSF